MKKLMLIGFVIVIALTSCDCSYDPTKYARKISDYEIVTVDSCEYIYREYKDMSYCYGFIEHKGDCRFCRERRQKEMQELIIALKEN